MGAAFKNKYELVDAIRKSGALSPERCEALLNFSPAKARKFVETEAEIEGWTPADVEALWAKKVSITIDADAGEELEVNTPEGPAPEAVEEDDAEDMEEKARPAPVRKSSMGPRLAKAVHAPAIGGKFAAQRKAYNRAVSTGAKWRGKDAIWSDADTAEAAVAWFRLKSFPNMDYAARSMDEEVVSSLGIKELGSGSTSTGGWAIPDEFSTDLIENMPRYGAVVRAAGVHNMPSASELLPRITSDATVAVVGEGSSASAQDKPEGDNVRLTAVDVMALVRAQNSWLRDTPLNAAGFIGESMARGLAKFIDQNALLSRSGTGASPSFQGVGDLVGANTTHDADYSAWGDFTVTDDTQLRAKLPGRAHDHSERIGYIMSAAYYFANFEKVGLSAGGATPLDFAAGVRSEEARAQFNADRIWNGAPVWFTSVMPTSYTANQLGAFYGAWDIAMKFGRVGGNFSIASSPDRYFEFNQTGFRLVDSIAINCHDVNNTAESSDADAASLVVALQD